MLISVVIPCYNVGNYIADCLESVLSQIYEPIEIIAIDNNSTDHTWQILQQYRQKHSELIRIIQEPRQGAPFARNRGLKEASGEWIQFLDADDLILPEKITKQVALIGEDISFIVGTPLYEDLNGKKTIVFPSADPFMGLFHGMRLGNTGANLWNRKWLEKVRGWDEDLPCAQDTDLMFRLLKQNPRVVIDSNPNTIWRARNSGQITQGDPVQILDQHLKLRERMIRYLKEEQSEYWTSYKGYFHHAVYRLIRMLAKHDLDIGNYYYEKLLPDRFLPNPFPELDIPVWNTRLVRLLGFYQAERLVSRMKKILPWKWWDKLKDLRP